MRAIDIFLWWLELATLSCSVKRWSWLFDVDERVVLLSLHFRFEWPRKLLRMWDFNEEWPNPPYALPCTLNAALCPWENIEFFFFFSLHSMYRTFYASAFGIWYDLLE